MLAGTPIFDYIEVKLMNIMMCVCDQNNAMAMHVS